MLNPLAIANDALRIRIGIWLPGYGAGSSLSRFETGSGSEHAGV